MGVAATAGVGFLRQDRLAFGIVERVVQPRDHARGVSKRGMRRDVLDALAVDPDFTPVAQALEVLLAGEGPRPRGKRHVACPSSSFARCSHSATKRNTFSAGGCGENVSSHRTGSLLTFANAWTQPTPVHSTLPAFARYFRPSSVASTSPDRMK